MPLGDIGFDVPLVEFMCLVFTGGVYVPCIYWWRLCALYLLVEFMCLVFTGGGYVPCIYWRAK